MNEESVPLSDVLETGGFTDQIAAVLIPASTLFLLKLIRKHGSSTPQTVLAAYYLYTRLRSFILLLLSTAGFRKQETRICKSITRISHI